MSRRGSKSSKSAKNKQPSAPPDVYVALLFVSLAALITGCIFLALVLNDYDWQRPTGVGSLSPAPRLAPAEPGEIAGFAGSSTGSCMIRPSAVQNAASRS